MKEDTNTTSDEQTPTRGTDEGQQPPAPSAGDSPGNARGGGPNDDEERQRELKAATVIQKRWKGHSVRTSDVKLSSDERWKQVLFSSEGVKNSEDADEGKNAPKERWHRALHASSQLQNGKAFSNSDETQGDDQDAGKSPLEQSRQGAVLSKTLEEQHWLEMLDPKHRYGSNLKYYHKAWEDDNESKENFYRWLDRGKGKDVSLPECSREQLEKERITYLSVEQRLNYYVVVDRTDGRIRWYKNQEHVDTTPRKWADGGPDAGIVPENSKEAEGEDPPPPLSASPSSSSLSSEESDQAQHYTGKDHSADFGPVGKLKDFFESFTLKGATDRLLRKTVGKDTFIFVSDLEFNTFVGLKKTGAFQHSSFLAGGRVSAAGLISVREGLITNLSPLSGHYRTTIEHYKEFITSMEQQGADLSKVKVTKAELMMFGLEKYGKVSKRVGKVKKSIFHPHAAKADREKEEREKKEHEEAIAKAAAQTGEPVDKKRSLADFKRDILYGRRKDETVEGAKKLAAKIGVDVEESKGEEEKQGREPSSNDKTQPSSDNDNAPAVDTTLSPADLPSPSSAKKDD